MVGITRIQLQKSAGRSRLKVTYKIMTNFEFACGELPWLVLSQLKHLEHVSFFDAKCFFVVPRTEFDWLQFSRFRITVERYAENVKLNLIFVTKLVKNIESPVCFRIVSWPHEWAQTEDSVEIALIKHRVCIFYVLIVKLDVLMGLFVRKPILHIVSFDFTEDFLLYKIESILGSPIVVVVHRCGTSSIATIIVVNFVARAGRAKVRVQSQHVAHGCHSHIHSLLSSGSRFNCLDHYSLWSIFQLCLKLNGGLWWLVAICFCKIEFGWTQEQKYR